jgi:hypothetical protein
MDEHKGPTDAFGNPISQEAYDALIAQVDGLNAKQALANALVVTDEPWDPATLPPRPWLAAPYLMRGEITLPHGPGGGGKSQLAIAWACALALGVPFGRLQPKGRAKIVLTNFEDNATEQMRRISSTLEWFGATPKDLKGWLYRVCVGPAGDATMFDIDERGAVRITKCWSELERHCEQIQPDGVFLDPLVALNAVPENDNQLMRRVFVMMRAFSQRFSCALVPMHHDNKSGDDSDSADQNNVRGGGDIVNATRFELAVKKMTVAQAESMGIDVDRRGYYFRVGSASSKLNYSAPEDSEWFERLAVDINGEEVVRCMPWTPPSSKLSQQLVDAVVAAVEKGTSTGPYSPQLTNTVRTLGPVMEAAGVSALAAQRKVLKEMLRLGHLTKATWKESSHAGTRDRVGLRSRAGLPYNHEWQDDGGQDDV